MVLVDTSVWVDHLRRGDARLIAQLTDREVACHPMVIGEIACGYLRHRRAELEGLASLPQPPIARDEEVLQLIDEHLLMGRGLGWVDMHLLASCRLGGVTLWTRDRRLADAAGELGIDGSA